MLASPTPTDIGKQRYFGPPGVGVAAFLSGVMVDNFPHLPISCYTGIFVNYAVACTGKECEASTLGALHFNLHTQRDCFVDRSMKCFTNFIIIRILTYFVKKHFVLLPRNGGLKRFI